MNTLMKEYIAIVNFFAKIVGTNVEIILHDISQVDHSAVAVVNGHVSGRKIGSSLNATGISFIKNEIYKDQDELLHYRGQSKNGLELICYTRFIKAEDGTLLGMMCINVDRNQEVKLLKDLTTLLNLNQDFTEVLLETKVLGNEVTIFKEHFPENVAETTAIVFDDIITELKLPKERLTYHEKLEVMKRLEERGIFLFKGAISEVAHLMRISEATAYRYLSKIEKGEH